MGKIGYVHSHIETTSRVRETSKALRFVQEIMFCRMMLAAYPSIDKLGVALVESCSSANGSAHQAERSRNL